MKTVTDNTKTEFSIMTDMLIVLAVLSIMTVYYYGARAAAIIVISVIISVLTDLLCLKVRHKTVEKGDLSSVITGLVLALMMPSAISYSIVIIAALFAIIIGKHAFGGHGHEIFNSAAVGFLFVTLSFPDAILSYSKPFNYLPLSSSLGSDTVLNQSMTKSFITTNTVSTSVMDILIGKFCGPMGTTFIILLLISAVFLILRRSISAISFFSQLAVVFIFSFGFYKYSLTDALNLMSCGMLIFGIIFLSCDYSTIPKTRTSRLMYGLIVGGLILVFQFYAKVENAIVYAVIIAAPFGIELDRKALSFAKMLSDDKKGIFAKLARRFNKNLRHMDETLTLINGSEKNESADKFTIHRKKSHRNSDKKTDL